MKIDPATNRITASTPLHATITDLAVGNGSVWVSIVPDNVVYRLSPDDGSVLATMPAGPWPASLSVGDGLWIADAKGTPDRAHRRRRGARRVPLSGPPLGHAATTAACCGPPSARREPVAPATRPDAQDPARQRTPSETPTRRMNCWPGLPAARLRDLRLPPQLPRRIRRRGPRAPARGRRRAAGHLRRRPDVHVPDPARLPVLAAVRPGRSPPRRSRPRSSARCRPKLASGGAAEPAAQLLSGRRRSRGVRGRARTAHQRASRRAATRSRSG